MTVHIIIDGYNLIRQSQSLGKIDRQDLQRGREVLVDRLAAYKKVKGYPVTVVFDGADALPGMDASDREKGIRIRFSRHGETADAVIKRMAAREKEKALVVSSDHGVVDFCASRGASVVGSREFEERMDMAAQMAAGGNIMGNEADEGWSPTTRKKGPSRRAPKRERKHRQRIMKI
jgi:uncharacterized protein